MFRKFTNGCVVLVQRYLPDPFLFAILLTIIVFLWAMAATSQGPSEMISHWYNNFWNLLSFSMQMVLILVTGHTLAHAPIFQRGLHQLAKVAKTPNQAIFMVTLVGLTASFINWGFGLVIGALYARELAKTVKNVDYRLLIAAAYSGFLVWHGGLSGSIPLSLASAGNLADVTAGAVTQPVATSQTIFSTVNLVIFGVIFLTLPFINAAMHPKEKAHLVTVDPELLKEQEKPKHDHSDTPASRLENSPILSITIGLFGLAYVVKYFYTNGFALNLNIMNFTFLFLGILLHRTPRNFLNAVYNAVKTSGGIIIQFPFYAGIMGMMVGVGDSGVSLAGLISSGFVAISNEVTFPFFTFLSAGIVNFFVPSGGGQWAVQAPIMMPAGQALGVAPAKTAMAIAWGDAWTNMIQPFWALPALAIAGLGARDVMGFCIINLLYSGLVISAILMIL